LKTQGNIVKVKSYTSVQQWSGLKVITGVLLSQDPKVLNPAGSAHVTN